MGTFYLMLCGFAAAVLGYFLWKKVSKWYQWALAIGLYVWVCLGISFVYINSVGYHHQATAVGATFFGISSLAGAFIVARSMGLIGGKKAEQAQDI